MEASLQKVPSRVRQLQKNPQAMDEKRCQWEIEFREGKRWNGKYQWNRISNEDLYSFQKLLLIFFNDINVVL